MGAGGLVLAMVCAVVLMGQASPKKQTVETEDRKMMEVIKILSAALTLILGIIATCVLVSQYRLQRQQVKLAVFDKRYAVYEATRKYLEIITQYGEATKEQTDEFLRNADAKDFLFESDVQDFLKELLKKGGELSRIGASLKAEAKERDKLVKQRSELVKWAAKQFEVSIEAFGKYLKMRCP